MRNAIVTSALVLLTFLSFVSASPGIRRRETSALDFDPTASASKTDVPSAASTVSQKAKETGGSDSAPVNGTAEASNSAANGTTTPTASSAAAATSTAAIDLDDPKTSPTCHISADTDKDHDPTNLMPFCSPIQNEHLKVGTKYSVTWDPSLFSSETIKLELKLVNESDKTNKWAQDVPNEPGTYEMPLFADLLRGENGTNFTLFAVDGPNIRHGPVFSLITNATTKGHKGDDKIGEKAGIP
ncbi:MAG: hypothetical protein Q9167_005557, partial [Letrouitia subvulpina]